ncbi:hypothetical protein ACA910_003078 [Epithemia clementina (nom. ined.)]
MNPRNSSEVVMVEVPPPEPPIPLTLDQMQLYEQRNQAPLPLPELDLDHSLLAAHDSMRRPTADHANGRVKIDLFGSSQSSGMDLEFAVAFTRPQNPTAIDTDKTVVRRSMADMKWLDDTVRSHKSLGGTLCGRILPPFPTTGNRKMLSNFSDDSLLNSSIKNTGGAIAAAAAGVGKIRSVAKSFFGSYFDFGSQKGKFNNRSLSSASQNPPARKRSSRHVIPSKNLPESYYNPNSHDGRARQLERYLNYLLDHPALCTSFPLNAILTASQSGLEAAKKSLEECNKSAKELKDQTPHLDDGGKPFVPLWLTNGSNDSVYVPNLAWVRTAAQAAIALRVHGMLETTGMPSASARLQHASLPLFGKTKQGSVWEDDSDGEQIDTTPDDNLSTATAGQYFEEGVVRVQSELNSQVNLDQSDDSYDLLPLPVPAPERRILTVGNAPTSATAQLDSRFHYGSIADLDFLPIDSHDDDSKSAVLGNMLVDENIDKLREVIGSVDNTISRCLSSSGGIGKARKERLGVQLEVIRGLDFSWEGLRGQFVSQRALLRGVDGMSQSRDLYEESDLILVDDLTWQSSLAHSAVGAAEDVRSAIRASRTAANAKAAADAAAMSAQSACGNGNFATMEEARAAQTRLSIAQSHAIHAAVVDHEAKSVKRRATLALAHDVKYWNVHRKRELLKSCLSFARFQHEATRRGVDAWSTLRDGFIGTPLVPTTQDRRSPSSPREHRTSSAQEHQRSTSVFERPATDHDEVVATIFESSDTGDRPLIIASEHSLFSPPATFTTPSCTAEDLENSETLIYGDPFSGTVEADAESVKSAEFCESEFCEHGLILPFATASPIPEEQEEAVDSSVYHRLSRSETRGDEILSASMQSLVEGLMSWGGGLDADEEHMALPAGMAASIVMEESAAFSASKSVTYWGIERRERRSISGVETRAFTINWSKNKLTRVSTAESLRLGASNPDSEISLSTPVNSIDDASRILSEWDRLYNPDNTNLASTSMEDLLPNLKQSVLLLNQQATEERKRDSTRGRCMLGICAPTAADGVQTLKSWVSALGLPRGLLHGMDKDGVAIEVTVPVYIKYNSGGVYTFEDIRKSGLGFDALWKPGDAMLEPYEEGNYRGVYFQVELEDGAFRQYLMPLDLFEL